MMHLTLTIVSFSILYFIFNSKSKVNVYIIDTPIDINHREFGGRAIITSFNQNKACADHGTHIAGIIGGYSVGVTTHVNLHSIGIIDCNNNASIQELVDSINWVIQNHQKPAIINLSIFPNELVVFKELDLAIENAINNGIIVISSAGNNMMNRCNTSPSTANDIILIGSISASGTRSSFSNYGDCITVYAEGEMIKSSISNNMYTEMSGTSQSTPYVTGLVADYIFKNEKGIMITQKEVKRFLQTISIDKKILG